MMVVEKANLMTISGLCLLFSFLFFMGEVSVASANVNGARGVKKRVMLFEMSKQKKVDIMFLQETHSDSKNATDWERELDGISILSPSSGGVAVLFSKNFKPISYDFEEIIKGRLLKVRALFENHVFVFICVYVPTSAVERMLF